MKSGCKYYYIKLANVGKFWKQRRVKMAVNTNRLIYHPADPWGFNRRIRCSVSRSSEKRLRKVDVGSLWKLGTTATEWPSCFWEQPDPVPSLNSSMLGLMMAWGLQMGHFFFLLILSRIWCFGSLWGKKVFPTQLLGISGLKRKLRRDVQNLSASSRRPCFEVVCLMHFIEAQSLTTP